jgi:hypothetical protein
MAKRSKSAPAHSPRPAKARRKGGARQGRKRAPKPRLTAATADRHDLYQRAVQSADIDVEFLARVFRSTTGRKALHFREDFCGTGLLSATWVQQGPQHTAEGFDIDPEPVLWGLAHNFEGLGEAAERTTVHLKDVREPGHRRYDLRIAQNFSYCVFKTRRELLGYFRAARESLVDDGMFVIDLHGGSEATDVMEEETRCGGFTYVWDQASYWPGTGEYRCHIHFRFKDGTELKRAFSYDWRYWSLTELRDVLLDAGFSRVESYFEGTAADGEGLRGENCASWIAYLAASR